MPIHFTRLWQTGQQMITRLVGLDRDEFPGDWPAVGGRGGPWPNEERLVEEANAALREWQAAQAQFQAIDGVRDPELVDHVIYRLEAAERKYVFLLRQVQQIRRGASPH